MTCLACSREVTQDPAHPDWYWCEACRQWWALDSVVAVVAKTAEEGEEKDD